MTRPARHAFTIGSAGDCAPARMGRAQAKALGYQIYQGEPCPSGHRGRRYVSTQRCVDCARQEAWARGAHDRSGIDNLRDERLEAELREVWDD